MLASKIENGYDIVAQLLGEMCDAGAISNTESNALREVVDVPGWVNKLLGNVGLPGSSLNPSPGSISSLQNPTLQPQNSGPSVPWRRPNVRHTSNEMYVDVIENLSVTLAPSGRPLSAFAYGSIAFNCKLSGVPDLLLTLTAAGGRSTIEQALELPVFHPCVRLARWREKPGELSFIPPDGRFVLAGYEVDLLPFTSGKSSLTTSNLHLPVSVDVKTSLGSEGADFEVRLQLAMNFSGTVTPPLSNTVRGGLGSRLGNSSPAFGGTSNQPVLEDVVVSISIPGNVRNVAEIRASRGDAHYSPGDNTIEWRMPTKDSAINVKGGQALLRGTVVGAKDHEEEQLDGLGVGRSFQEYDEGGYQTATQASRQMSVDEPVSRNVRKVQRNAALMPSSATVSFAIKGWLASGIRIDSLNINTRQSKGLGDTVKPYKGVKYLTVSRNGVEIRC